MGLFDSSNLRAENEQLKQRIRDLESTNRQLRQQLEQLGYSDIVAAQQRLAKAQEKLNNLNTQLYQVENDINNKLRQSEKLDKQIKTNTDKLAKIKDCAQRVNYALQNYVYADRPEYISSIDINIMENLTPSIILKLHCMDIKDLNKAYRENDKMIDKLLQDYSSRYTTKANQAIYNLMVIALRAELQNILYNLKYEKLNKSIEDVRSVTQKYLKIAGNGNQSIIGTLTKFIGEVEYLFINAVKIEYNYYVKREQAKEEQLALREQMRQEAEERKALETEKKRIAKEEEKYNAEIAKVTESLTSASNQDEINKLKARILELQSQLSDVVIKREEITTLQNGKAGTVYIISNLGSFGDNIFKIGMTRRLEPQERINELSNASVPFKFDVHSFIFSEDAVSLENKMHMLLNNRRVNKVNMRKEFFNVSINELEDIVNKIDSTAEFKKTMLAEEFRQSISSDENYSSDYKMDIDSIFNEPAPSSTAPPKSPAPQRITLDPSKTYLKTKWGIYEMPKQYKIKLTYGPRTDIEPVM